jgi:hypothetical protein
MTPIHHREYRFESELVSDILGEFGARSWLRLRRNNVGMAYGVSIVKKFLGMLRTALKRKDSSAVWASIKWMSRQRPVVFASVGEPDFLGIIISGPFLGRAVAIECKIGDNKLDPDQVKWRALYGKYFFYALAYQVQDVYDQFAEQGLTW